MPPYRNKFMQLWQLHIQKALEVKIHAPVQDEASGLVSRFRPGLHLMRCNYAERLLLRPRQDSCVFYFDESGAAE